MNSQPSASFFVIKYNLSHLLPLRIILRKEDNIYKGVIENSFSIELSDKYVRLWTSGKAYSFLGEHILNADDDARHNSKKGDLIMDPFDEKCPIEIDWDKWRAAKDKFNIRNASFKYKEFVK